MYKSCVHFSFLVQQRGNGVKFLTSKEERYVNYC